MLAAVKAALAAAFSFASRGFGQPVFSSEVISAMQDVPGVVAMTLGDFRPSGAAAQADVLPAAAPTLGPNGLVGARAGHSRARPAARGGAGLMSSADADALYALLPAFVRMRDQTEGGGVLQALVGVIAGQAQVVSAALDQQYDDQFIETCALWAVPYIGDLIGFTPLRPLGPGQPSATRAEVADTIGYRQRKGTLAMLEQLCSDVTGWPGMAVEYFTRLSTTQYVRNHLRLTNAIVDVHSPMTAVDIGGAFDFPPRSADVRRIDSGRGRYNIPNIGLFVWRLSPYGNQGHPVRAVGPNRYTFDPFGGDVPLVNPPVNPLVNQPSSVLDQNFSLVDRPQLPFFLQRYPLFAAAKDYSAPAPVSVTVSGAMVGSAAISWCDLSAWTPPAAAGITVAVDPVLGRLVFATPPAAGTVTVDYTYAFSGDYGGGAYEQAVPADEAELEQALGPAVLVSSFATADLSTASNEVVEIGDSGIHEGNLALSPGAHLLVVRAGDLQRPVVNGGVTITAVDGAQRDAARAGDRRVAHHLRRRPAHAAPGALHGSRRPGLVIGLGERDPGHRPQPVRGGRGQPRCRGGHHRQRG